MMGDRKLILSESKIIYMSKGNVRSLAVTANAKSSQRGLDVSRRIWWTCPNGHKGKWSSSEKYGEMYSNNLQFSSALLLSGSNYSKVELMTRFLRLSCPSKALFFREQKFNGICY